MATKKTKSLKEYQMDVVAIFSKYEKQGTKRWDYTIAARDLVYQVGSLSKILLQLENARYRDEKTDAELRAGAADELADIFAEVLFIAHGMNISLENAWETMLDSDKKKISARTKK